MRYLTRHTGTKFHGTVTRSMFYKGHLYKGHTVGMYDFLLLFDTKTNQKIALSIRDGYSGYLEVSLINQIVCTKFVTTAFSTADGHLSSRGIDITQPDGESFLSLLSLPLSIIKRRCLDPSWNQWEFDPSLFSNAFPFCDGGFTHLRSWKF